MMKRVKLGLLGAGLVALGCWAYAAQWVFQAVPVAAGVGSVTNGLVTITNGTANALAIPPNVPVTLFVICTGNSTNTATVTNTFDTSMDGTNWTQNGPIKTTNTLNLGTNTGQAFNFTAAQMVGVQFLRQDSTGTGSATAVTNAGVTLGYFQ